MNIKKIVCVLLSAILWMTPIHAQETINEEEIKQVEEKGESSFVEENLIEIPEVSDPSESGQMLANIKNKYEVVGLSAQNVLDQIPGTNDNNSNEEIDYTFTYYLEEDLYLSEDVRFARPATIFSSRHHIYILPKFHLAIRQCDELTDAMSKIASDTELIAYWNQFLADSQTSKSISDLKLQLGQMIEYNERQLIETENEFYKECNLVLNFLLGIEDAVPTVKVNHPKFQLNMRGSTFYVLNQAILQLNQGEITYDDYYVSYWEVDNRTEDTLVIDSGAKLLGPSLKETEGNHLVVKEIPFITNDTDHGVAIRYNEETEDITQLAYVNINSNGDALIHSKSPLFFKSVTFTTNNKSASFVDGVKQVVLDQCNIERVSNYSEELTYLVQRSFLQQLSPSLIEIEQANVDNYVELIPDYLSMELVLNKDEGYESLDAKFKELIESNSIFITPFVQYLAITDEINKQVILTPSFYWTYDPAPTLRPFIENNIKITLVYTELPIVSNLFRASYDSEYQNLLYSYYLHSFTKFTPYLYDPMNQEERQIDELIEEEQFIIEVDYPDDILKENHIYLKDIPVTEDLFLRLKFENSLYSEAMIDIPIEIDGVSPKPPLTGGNGNDNGETTGGGGRDEVEREPNGEMTEIEPSEEIPMIEPPVVITPEQEIEIANEMSVLEKESKKLPPKQPIPPKLKEDKATVVEEEDKQLSPDKPQIIRERTEITEEKSDSMNQTMSTFESIVASIVAVLNKVVSLVIDGVNHLIDWFLSLFN